MTKNKQKSNGLVGAILLIAGSCIGGGMLALPVTSGLAGFFPALIAFLFSWAFMLATGLVLVEANVRQGQEVSLVTLSDNNLGPAGKWVAWLFFLFLFYALGVAYISISGSLISVFLKKQLGVVVTPVFLRVVFTLILALLVYVGPKVVVGVNRYLMLGLVVAYVALLFSSVSYVDIELLEYANPVFAVFAIPVMMLSFGFHNMIPSVNNYFKGNIDLLKKSIVMGSVFAVVVYLVWQMIVMGVVPISGSPSIEESLVRGMDGAQALILITRSPYIVLFSACLAIFAVTTSFLAQALSLVDFWADGLRVQDKQDGITRLGLVLLSVLPPFLISVLFPGVFLKALSFGGGICAMVLFGILPSLMCVQGRKKKRGKYQFPGGALTLYLLVLLSCFVIGVELLNQAGYGIRV